MNFKVSSNTGDNNQAAPISIVFGESLGNDGIKEEVERQFKKIQVKDSNSRSPFQEECKKPNVVPKKRKGRPPRVMPPKVPKEESDDLPPLMVNQREKRKRSNKFNTFLEVLRGEKDFYIDDDGIEEPKVKKRGGGRKKRNPVIIEASEPVKDDDLEENVCVIQVTDMDLQHREDNSEDRDRLNLDDVVQEIFGMTNEAETSLIQDIERMEHDNSLIDVIDKMNEVQETSENNGIIDLKKIVSMTNLKFDVKTEPGIDVESELLKPIDFVDEMIPSIEITEVKEDIVPSAPSVEMTITQSADNTLQAEISDPELSAIVQENTLPTLSKIKQECGMEETIAEKRRYRCKLCSEVFCLIEEARAHAKEFHRGNKKGGESVFACSECDRSFPTVVGRDRHHLHMHLKHKPVSCQECFAVFNSFRPLERHLRHKHDQDPKLFCEMCDAEFVLGTSLERHKEIMHPVQLSSRNTGKSVNKNVHSTARNKNRPTKKLECPFCKEKFVSSRSLKIHHRKKHNGKEYMCKYCKYKTECLSTMHRHMVKVHKALDMKLHNCQKCMAGYHDPRDLEEHYVSVHHLELSLHCQHCGDKFACLEMLRFHRNSHRAFSCKLCHLGFMKEEALEDHIKTVHNCDPVGIAENGDPLNQVEAENCGEEILPMEKKKKTTESKSSTASSKVLVITSDGTVQVKDEPKEQNSLSSVPSEDITLHLHQTQEGVLEAMDMFNPIKGQKAKDLPKKMHCLICNKYLTTKFLRTHMLSHKGNLPHKCQFCDKAYAQGTLLRKHMKNRHYEEFLKLGNKNPKKHKVACHFCQEVFDTIYLLEEHLWQHMDEKLLECKDCKIKFGMESNLREHYKSHFFKEAQPCPVCRREFKSIGFYNEHVEKCQQRWKCEHCGMECDSQDYYRKHQRSEHGGERVTRYQCNQCEKSFVERHRYVDHVITHSTEKAFSCHICEKQFKRQRPLNDHILRAHCDSMFMCSTCRKAFPTQQELDVHKQKHRKEFPCTYCTQIYSSNEALMNHLMVHHSNSSHVCRICSQTFQKQANLKTHLITHNITTPHICLMDGCYKMFRSEALLRTHMIRRHRGFNYECSVCDRKFALETDHIKHMATHVGEVPLPCDKCGKSFQNEALLERHLLTHCQEKPYECALCHHTGTQYQQVARHIEEEHHFADVSPYLLVNRWRCSACRKLFVVHESLMKHLQEHSTQGTQAEGHPVKTRSTPSSVLELSAQSGNIDSTPATNTFLEQITALGWQDLSPLLRLDVIPSDTEEQEATGVWQCPGCNEVKQTEDVMKEHLITSTQCHEAVILHLAYGFNNTQELEEEPSACNYNEVLDDKGSGTVLQLTDSSGGMQYVIVHEQEEDSSQEKLVDMSKESNSDQEGVGGMQMLMSMEELLSQPANPNIQIIVEDSAPLKQLLDEGVSEAGQSSQPDLPREESESSAPLLNGSEILLQTPDGQLVLQQTVGGVTQFQLVEGVDATEQGEEPQLTTHSSAFHPEFLLPD